MLGKVVVGAASKLTIKRLRIMCLKVLPFIFLAAFQYLNVHTMFFTYLTTVTSTYFTAPIHGFTIKLLEYGEGTGKVSILEYLAEYNHAHTEPIFNPLGTGNLKLYQSPGLSIFWGLFVLFL